MLKKINQFFILLILFPTWTLAAPIAPNPTEPLLNMNVVFDWQQQPQNPLDFFSGKPIHVSKTIQMAPNQLVYSVIMSQSKVVNNYPATLVLLAKPVKTHSKKTEIQFVLMQYGFVHPSGIIWTAPQLIFDNQQNQAEFKTPESNNPHIRIHAMLKN